MGLFKIIIAILAGSILLSFINFTGLFDFITEEAIRGIIIVFIVGFVVGLVTGSSFGGAVAGAITAFIMSTANYLVFLMESEYKEIKPMDLYIEWFQNTQLKLLIVALIGGFIGGFIISAREKAYSLLDRP